MKLKNFLLAALSLLLILITVKKAHAEIVIAVLDTGLSNGTLMTPLCKVPYIDFTKSNITGDADPGRHGSNIVSLIVQNAGPTGYCIQIYKIFRLVNGKLQFDVTAYLQSLQYMIKHPVSIVNLSIAGTMQLKSEAMLLKKILDSGTQVVAAAGNAGIDFNKKGCIIYPACTDERILVVGNSTSYTSNIGRQVDVWEDGTRKFGAGVTMTGTSQAAAITTGLLVKRAAYIKRTK